MDQGKLGYAERKLGSKGVRVPRELWVIVEASGSDGRLPSATRPNRRRHSPWVRRRLIQSLA